MPLHYVAWVKALSLYGMVFPEPRFYAMGGIPTAKIIETLSAEQGIFVDIGKVGAIKEEFFMAAVTAFG